MVFRTRGGIMSAVTRVENYVADISDAEKEDVGYRMTLNTQLNLVKSMKAKYAIVQDEVIESQTLETNRTIEIANKAAFFTRCDKLIKTLNVLIQEAPETSGEGDVSDPFNTSSSSDVTRFMMSFMKRSEERHQQQMELLLASMSETTNNPIRPVTKLPQIKLPTFDGKFSSWTSFKDRFTASVIKVTNISNSTRLEHLLSSVEGDAKALIKNISITDANFPVAWKMLEDKFERKSDIVAEHIRHFFAMPRATATNSQEIHQITNTLAECTMALDALKVTQRDPWLIQYCLDRLDSESRIRWGRECSKEVPTLEQFTKFLNQRCIDSKNAVQPHAKAPSSGTNASRSSHAKPAASQKKQANALVASTSSAVCKCCQESSHPLFKCAKFLSQSSGERFNTVRSLSLCRNCFATHMTHSCTFRRCSQCQGRHNQLLHEYYASATDPPASPSEDPPAPKASGTSKKTVVSKGSQTGSSAVVAVCASKDEQADLPPRVFLATASVHILTATGETIPCRLVLDGGAQVNIMTSDLYKRLNLPRFPTKLAISGVNESKCRARYFVNVTIYSRTSDSCFNFKCFVLPKVSGDIPNWPVDASQIQIPHDIELADPEWNVQRPVDLLLSGNHYWASWLNDTIELGPGLPLLKETVFGHVVVGEHEPLPPPEAYNLNVTALEDTLRKFWEVEEVSNDNSMTDDQRAAEHHFVQTHQRDPTGRFIVQLPFKKDPTTLGDSRPLAIRQFLSLERKFERNPTLRTMYADILDDQLKRGWIEPVPREHPEGPVFYLPHHGVLKESSATTKLRIVYNASAKSTTGISLNEILRIGPTVQPDLATTLLRFRSHQYAMTADISKMYLQLKLHEDHTDFQRFVWRPSRFEPIRDYRITRVSFGVASSPFLATRALIQPAQEHESTHPLAAEALRNAFYVDDCIISTDSIESAKRIQIELLQVLQKGGFLITKWKANHPDLEITDEDSPDTVHITDSTTSALGIVWNSNFDVFMFRVPIAPDEDCGTIRKMLSAVAKIFDPLGLVGPVVIVAKIIIQDSRREKLNLDDPVPEDLMERWSDFLIKLQHLDQISIPRCATGHALPLTLQLHAFADASQRAYGAALYMVATDSQGNISSHLLTAKSRVAPCKQPLTIPQLELSGALLAVSLVNKVKDHFPFESIHFWSDSMVALYWINGDPGHYKIFVADRVKKIQASCSPAQWRHVRTHENPADLISRGVSPMQLKEASLWWHGPSWLCQPDSEWPPIFNQAIRDAFHDATALVEVVEPSDRSGDSILSQLLDKHSSLSKIQRIMAYCLRFLTRGSTKRNPPSSREIIESLERLILLDQSDHFPGLAAQLQRHGHINSARYKCFARLTPFVDDKGLIRVGGRLENSNMPFQSKHPILLPKSRLSQLIVHREHLMQLHAGPLLLLSTVRQRYWPISGRSLVKKVCHQCPRCSRANPRTLEQLMADLPRDRVNFCRPFQATGVDYAGPVLYRQAGVRETRTRNLSLQKGFICVFVCMATKAVHLEFVTGLSTEGFLAAFRRFAARRNAPRDMYSDCGTNFEGASRELSNLFRQHQFQSEIVEGTVETGVTWHFNPSRAPHHGGLWEACVKRVKFHLSRVVQHTHFSYEELSTILCQIEAILNSRPISLMSDDPNERDFLTPGHFLTGVPGNCLPDPDLSHIPRHRLSMWQHCQERAQDFARKFRLLYLNTLQQRSKWTMEYNNVKVDDLVLLLDETQMGNKWILGQVANVHPGRDGRIRVLTIRTTRGTYTRPITKVARLFKNEENLCSGQSPDCPEPTGENVGEKLPALK